MTDPAMHSTERLEKTGGRKLLRNSAIIAAGVVLLLSFITGCTKIWDVIHGGGSTPGSNNEWIGGFAQSDTAFAYPNPDLSSLPLLGNMDNIDSLDRQQAIVWPEFSWETEPGSPDPKRCYQMFAPDISRIGYTKNGRIYSIICPQQGICFDSIGCMNIEVSVTGQRGWVDEPSKLFAGDMTVEGKIWFSPSALSSWTVKAMWDVFNDLNHTFPSDKAHAIRVTIHKVGDSANPLIAGRSGQSTLFTSPAFAIHNNAFAVGHIDVEIGPIVKTHDPVADEFNQSVMDLFNVASGNLLKDGNILSWNVWSTPPAVVDQEEWRTHAERWRASIDEEHGPAGGTIARFFDGTPFDAVEEKLVDLFKELLIWIFSL